MDETQAGSTYRIWGADNEAYGPVDLPVVLEWIGEERVVPETWVYVDSKSAWIRAGELAELQEFLPPPAPATTETGKTSPPTQPAISVLQPRNLRRIKILASLTDSELETLIKYVEVQDLKIFSQVVRIGEHGDAMYLILSGELRARTVNDGKETTLATLGIGDYFGEISLLDEGPRSADVIANTDAQVIKLSADSFNQLKKEHPQLAMHFMYALGRSAAGKIRTLTKKYQDSIQFSRYAQWT